MSYSCLQGLNMSNVKSPVEPRHHIVALDLPGRWVESDVRVRGGDSLPSSNEARVDIIASAKGRDRALGVLSIGPLLRLVSTPTCDPRSTRSCTWTSLNVLNEIKLLLLNPGKTKVMVFCTSRGGTGSHYYSSLDGSQRGTLDKDLSFASRIKTLSRRSFFHV